MWLYGISVMPLSEESTSLKNFRKCTLAKPTQKCTSRKSAQAKFSEKKVQLCVCMWRKLWPPYFGDNFFLV